MSFFDVLLRIVPCAACVSHHDSQQNTRGQSAGQHTAQSFYAQQDTDQKRCDDCHQTRNDHFLQSSSCGNVYAVSIVRLGSTFHDSLVGTELSSYFFDHLVCSTSYGVHSERGEHERQHSSDEQTNDYDRLKQADIFDLSNFREGCEQSQSCQSSRTDRESLTDSSRCVTNGVQLVRDLSYVFRQFGHFCDTAGVIGYRTISVNGNCHTGRGQHTYSSQCDTVKTSCCISCNDRYSDAQDRQYCGQHAYAQTTDNSCSGTSLRLFCDFLNGFVISGSVNFCDFTNSNADYQTSDDRNSIIKASQHCLR